MKTIHSFFTALLLYSSVAHAAPPNILFIAVDDLRPELATYGAEVKTPHLDRLAESGVRFDRAYCNQAVCGASRLSLMGGLYPTKTGEQNYHVTGWRKRHPDLVTMNQHFRANGYQVIGTGKIYHGTGGEGIDPQNWDEWIQVPGKSYVLPESTAEQKRRIKANPGSTGKDHRGTVTESADVADDVYTDGARAVVAAEKLSELAGGDQPFFFAVGFIKPHLPFIAPKKYWDLYERSDFSMPDNLSFPPGYPDYARNAKAGEMSKYSDYEGKSPLDFSDELNKRLLHGYAACVSYTDANVGLVLDALENSDAADNTIVVFWGDHGWKLGDHSSWCKHTNFEVDTRVPLIMRVPGGESGAACQEPVELIDLYPTLCDLASIEKPAHLQGKSFQNLLSDPDADHRTSAYSSYPHAQVTGHSIRAGKYRYTEWYRKKEKKPEAFVLTDLAADPGEETNVATEPEHAEALDRLKRELRKRMAEALR
ncbi:MAG: sulfatase [Verrucomicrobiales bacterium]|nr:sulfatase [Verrucomicrobiales bacterium]